MTRRLAEFDRDLEVTRRDIEAWRPEPRPLGPDDRTPMPSLYGDDEPTLPTARIPE